MTDNHFLLLYLLAFAILLFWIAASGINHLLANAPPLP